MDRQVSTQDLTHALSLPSSPCSLIVYPYSREVDAMGNDVGPYRVWMNKGPMLGLAMSRSLGDRLAHTVGVIAEPEVGDCMMNHS